MATNRHIPFQVSHQMLRKTEYIATGSRTIASEENCPPNSKLTLTLTEGHFFSDAIVWLPSNPKTNPDLDPNPNSNRKGIVRILLWFCPDTVAAD